MNGIVLDIFGVSRGKSGVLMEPITSLEEKARAGPNLLDNQCFRRIPVRVGSALMHWCVCCQQRMNPTQSQHLQDSRWTRSKSKQLFLDKANPGVSCKDFVWFCIFKFEKYRSSHFTANVTPKTDWNPPNGY